MAKKNVYLLQINTPTDRNLLPLAAGLMVSYAKSIPELKENYNFSIEVLRRSPATIVNGFSEPEVLGLSCYSWNTQHTFEVAKLVKKRWPGCLVVMGGPSNPATKEEMSKFIKDCPFIDVFVYGEGELVFPDILKARLNGGGLGTVPGITYIDGNSPEGFTVTSAKPRIDDLNAIPSPFLDGTFDELMAECGENMTGTLWETNRGCPYSCTFCFWGQVQRSRIRTFDLARLQAEVDWMSRNKIRYIYSADANFGILPRDNEVAQMLADSCAKTGYPSFFMINWAKHSSRKIFEIADILQKGGVGFRITLSRQSFNPETLKAVKRVNLPLPEFYSLIKEANSYEFSTYTDLIMAMPMESYESFTSGLRHVFHPYLNYHYSIYLCRLLTGSEMAEPSHIENYKIETRRCLVEMGRRATVDNEVSEYENIVVATSTLPLEDWKRLYTFCYGTIPLFNYRLAFFVLNYLKYEHSVDILDMLKFIIDRVQEEKSRYRSFAAAMSVIEKARDSIIDNGQSVIRVGMTGSIAWEPYEAAQLIFVSLKESFFQELWDLTLEYIKKVNIAVDPELLKEVFAYQIASIPGWDADYRSNIEFSYNIPQYFAALNADGIACKLLKEKAFVRFGAEKDVWKDAQSFASSRLEGGHTFKIYRANMLSEPDVSSSSFKAALDFASEKLKINEMQLPELVNEPVPEAP